jgi:transcription initiation factor TFIID subunit 7
LSCYSSKLCVNRVCPEILDNVNPDLSDSEFIERDEPLDAPTPAISDLGEFQTLGDDLGDMEDEGDGDEEDEGAEGDIDEELAAELDLALGDEEDEEGDGDDEEEDEDDSEEDEDEDEDDEAVQARKLINEEIRDLEAAVAKKGKEIASSANPLIKVCQTSNCSFCLPTIICCDLSETIRRCFEEAGC